MPVSYLIYLYDGWMYAMAYERFVFIFPTYLLKTSNHGTRIIACSLHWLPTNVCGLLYLQTDANS